MKKTIVFIAIIAITTNVFAQQIEKQFIEVTGAIYYKSKIDKYVATVVVSPEISYGSLECLNTIQSNYLGKLKKAGIDMSKVKESKFGFLTLGYRKKGTLYVFESASKEEYMKVLNVYADGTMPNEKYVYYKKELETESDLSEKAIENARKKAESIAKRIHKKIGGIIALSDQNMILKEPLYNGSEEFEKQYTVEVRFELLN